MAKAPIFLVGGGRDEAALKRAHSGLADALAGGRLLCLVADEGSEGVSAETDSIDSSRWQQMLTQAGVREVSVLRIARDRPACPDDLAGFAGLYLAGGLTPLYAELTASLAGALPAGLVYGGFSAGAAVAARLALVGGWLHEQREIAPEDSAEDLEELTVRPGLGLVDFAVEVHATSWGNLSRAVHAVRTEAVPQCWAIDENTALQVHGDELRVVGAGFGYLITRISNEGEVSVRAFPGA